MPSTIWPATRREAPPLERVICDRCATPYAPSLTRHACPLCGRAAPGARDGGVTLLIARLSDPDDRVVGLVVAATLLNLLLLAALAVVVLTA